MARSLNVQAPDRLELSPSRSSNGNKPDHSGTPDQFDVVVVGGGQAGLAAGHHLARQGLNFVILDAHSRVGDAWRNRWDSLTLFTPAKMTGLPGMRFPAPAYHFPTKDEVADYLESYAEAMRLPIRLGTTACHVRPSGDSRWLVETGDMPMLASSVVIATGGYQTPKIPAWASELDPGITQIHSMDYRNASQFQAGPVLIVGASHSGADIAIEATHHDRTVLVGRDTGQIPIPTTGRLVPFTVPVIWFVVNHVMTVHTPMGRKAKRQLRAHGFPLEHPSRSDIAAAGVERITARATGVRDGKPMLDDGQVLDVRNVVWCTGFQEDYSWIEGLTYGEDSYPEEDHGVVTGTPGIYFVGLRFQRSGASSLVGGVGRDAKYIARHIAKRKVAHTR
ncbi:MAG: NAD(P)-binding domain-containing protein [Nitrolancea sp.]